jgi:hypothetical protein
MSLPYPSHPVKINTLLAAPETPADPWVVVIPRGSTMWPATTTTTTRVKPHGKHGPDEQRSDYSKHAR